MSVPNLLESVRRAVDRVRQDAKGAKALNDWIGENAIPVAHETAEARAAVCSRCPQNQRRRKVENAIAEKIRAHEEIRSQVMLRTSQDVNLHNCVSCGCYLKLKVWVPIEHQTTAPFPPHCWVLKERGALLPKQDDGPPPPSTPPPPSDGRPVVSIKRTDAFGDVIMASILATKMAALGFRVQFSGSPVARTALHNHAAIETFLEPMASCMVNLDGCYETHPERVKKDIALLMLEAAARQLTARRMPVPDFANRVPDLVITPDESAAALEFLSAHPKPWTIIIPKSASWKNRSLNESELAGAAQMLPGTSFWGYPSGAPTTCVQTPIRQFRELMALISHADLVITPDTGPLHVAAAFNRKVILLETCNFSPLRITNLTDYSEVSSPTLTCIGCGHFQCPIDAEKPPCSNIPGHIIGHAAAKKLATAKNSKVSAIIPVYRPHDRLLKCVNAVRDQVDEIVVCLDGNCAVSNLGPKVVVVKNATGERTGFGKTCMRGARHSTGEFLLMLNDDCYLDPGAVDAMKSVMAEKVAVVGCQLWYPDGTLQHGGTTRNRGDIGFGHIDHRRRTPSITAPRRMENVTFAAALVRRSAFYAVRGFDERFDCYSEDADFCMKVRQAGWTVIYQPMARGIHDESQSTNPTKLAMLKYGNDVFKAKWERFFTHNPPP